MQSVMQCIVLFAVRVGHTGANDWPQEEDGGGLESAGPPSERSGRPG